MAVGAGEADDAAGVFEDEDEQAATAQPRPTIAQRATRLLSCDLNILIRIPRVLTWRS
jgi:hypothetical protein